MWVKKHNDRGFVYYEYFLLSESLNDEKMAIVRPSGDYKFKWLVEWVGRKAQPFRRATLQAAKNDVEAILNATSR